MFDLGAVTQGFVDVVRHISNLERTHGSVDLLSELIIVHAFW